MVRTAFNTTLVVSESWIQRARPHRGAIANCVPISLTLIAAGETNRFRVHASASENLVYLLDAKEVTRSRMRPAGMRPFEIRELLSFPAI
ncbi:MAG: hypothetical protein NT138_09875 [Planctomycetales bacterium]|nr:hypothetical protein [Planctomycetales bacterium]